MGEKVFESGHLAMPEDDGKTAHLCGLQIPNFTLAATDGPQSCAFRDHFAELKEVGTERLFGLSTQATDYQKEVVERLHLPFPLLSDSSFSFSRALVLPLFVVGGMILIKRLTLIINNGKIEHVFYRVLQPERNASDVIAWLSSRYI
ncbi:redoxin family protein [Paenibacillus sp. Lou8.1]|uniref:redoxin family protein n=1 Tax=Paenibacillus sp. Lou8.1 TaxID=2962041 RepID=UPI0020B6A9C6|nr:redoxin family protein [Paenibacillus sp. Lou8.1]MCP3809947.1 redoxin family protein [Paenibacillus sp. Lou8.1]